MIIGEEQPDAGALAARRHGRARLRRPVARRARPEKTVWEEISDGYEHIKVGDREVNSRAYVAGFNFKGSDQQRKVGALSGGERNRVHLAKLLRTRRQRAAARRAHQRPRRRHAARARGGAARVPGLRGDDLPRSLVPRPDRHARARVRGRLAGRRGSRATSRPTRSTGASGSAPRPTARTGSRTRSSRALSRSSRPTSGWRCRSGARRRAGCACRRSWRACHRSSRSAWPWPCS